MVMATIESLGYGYRATPAGMAVIAVVLDTRPVSASPHLHVIAHGDPQWDRYLAFVERLRTDPDAHAAYGDVKQQLAAAHPDGRQAYTKGKSDIVEHLVTRPRSGRASCHRRAPPRPSQVAAVVDRMTSLGGGERGVPSTVAGAPAWAGSVLTRRGEKDAHGGGGASISAVLRHRG